MQYIIIATIFITNILTDNIIAQKVWISNLGDYFPVEKFVICKENVKPGRYVAFTESGDTYYELTLWKCNENYSAEFSSGYVEDENKEIIKVNNFSIKEGKINSEIISGTLSCLAFNKKNISGFLIKNPFAPNEKIFLEYLN